MLYLSQRDPHWGGKTIGKTKYLVKDWGCTLTCVSMASDWFKCYHDPGWMAKHLQYTNDAKLYWHSINEMTCFKFDWRFYKHDEKRIMDGLKDPNKVCLLNVYNKHWVLAIRKVPFGYWVVDPWSGTRKFYSTSSISGGAILKK